LEVAKPEVARVAVVKGRKVFPAKSFPLAANWARLWPTHQSSFATAVQPKTTLFKVATKRCISHRHSQESSQCSDGEPALIEVARTGARKVRNGRNFVA
jgi:hypothetical protein